MIIRTPRGDIRTPAFLPDATHGVVRSIDAADLESAGVPALVMNTYHLMLKPGSTTVKALGGVHAMSGWRGPILTDSGGFQAYSLIRENPRRGSLAARGITFRPEGTERDYQLTPEKTIQLQLGYGADILVCLDDCRHVDDTIEAHRESVDRTIDWCRRGKRELERLLRGRSSAAGSPLLFAVIQGGGSFELRRRCAEALLEIGFDGYGFGGWPLDARGSLLTDVLAFTRSLVPLDQPFHALGIGHPANVVAAAAMGYDTFDSALPTRDARDGRLYAAPRGLTRQALAADDWFDRIYVHDERHTKANGAVYPGCPCFTCQRYGLGYLHHLFEIKDGLYARLATIHNLRFMSDLMTALRE